VIGCDKTTLWGMAALANVTQHKVSQLKFKVTEDSSVKSTRPSYTWDYSGIAEVKVGPDIKEVNALRSNDPLDTTPPSDEEFSNQCLFIRTLNATLNNKEWKLLNDTLSSTNVLDSNRTIFPEIPPRSQRSIYDTSFNTPQPSSDHSNLGNQRSLTQPTQALQVCTAFSGHLNSLQYYTQLEDGAILSYRNVAPFKFDHLDVPSLPSQLPHPNIENDVHEGRSAISTTPDAAVSHQQTF